MIDDELPFLGSAPTWEIHRLGCPDTQNTQCFQTVSKYTQKHRSTTLVRGDVVTSPSYRAFLFREHLDVARPSGGERCPWGPGPAVPVLSVRSHVSTPMLWLPNQVAAETREQASAYISNILIKHVEPIFATSPHAPVLE